MTPIEIQREIYNMIHESCWSRGLEHILNFVYFYTPSAIIPEREVGKKVQSRLLPKNNLFTNFILPSVLRAPAFLFFKLPVLVNEYKTLDNYMRKSFLSH